MQVRGVIRAARLDATTLVAVLGIEPIDGSSPHLSVVTTLPGFSHIVSLFHRRPGATWLDDAATRPITFIVNPLTLDVIGFSINDVDSPLG